jgi:hypothetical protein
MTEETRTQQGEPPAPDPNELTDAELDQVAGGGGDSGEGLQPSGSNRKSATKIGGCAVGHAASSKAWSSATAGGGVVSA